MKNPTSTNGLLRSRADLARSFGLPPKARARDIASAFGRAMRCDAWLRIEEDPEIAHSSEIWEIRIVRSSPHCRVELRKDGRGDWVRQATEMPSDVLGFFSLREARDGGIISSRSWEAWMKRRWLKGRGRRLKGRSGEILAIVEVPDVGRETGKVREFIVIEPLCADDSDVVTPRRFSLPVYRTAILQTVEEFRRAATVCAA